MAVTKTTVIEEVDSWQEVAGGVLVEGAVKDVSGSYASLLFIEAALIEAVASDGVEIIVEVSYADDNWVKFQTLKGTSETPVTTTINDASVDATDITITLTDATTGDFDIIGRKWFIKDGTIANSESVRTKSISTHTITLCQDLLRAHANSLNVYDRVDEWVVEIPFAVAQCRVLFNNVDTDCDAVFTTRCARVTGV